MAEVMSLGVRLPVALPYLIAESILPAEPAKDQYRWASYPGGRDGDDEILHTEHCVVWSRGCFVRRVFRFAEEESVIQAVLTSFPLHQDNTSSKPNLQPANNREEAAHDGGQPHVTRGGSSGFGRLVSRNERYTSQNDVAETTYWENTFCSRDKALVIFLKTQAQVHFLAGASHIVNLSFEIERSFPTPKGLLAQRKLTTQSTVSATPQIPPPPQNSFFSSQITNSHVHSRPATGLSTLAQLEATLLELRKRSTPFVSHDVPKLYVFMHPSSVMSPIAIARLVTSTRSSPSVVQYEPFCLDEELVYVSAQDEFSESAAKGDMPLIILVTTNREAGTASIWQAWYPKNTSVSTLLQQKQAEKVTGSKRRSSFAGPATGANTPAIRRKEGTRESFAGSGRVLGEPHQAKPTAPQATPRSFQDAEDALASQMDPDFDPPLQPSKESRRISSLLSRADLATGHDRPVYSEANRGSTGATASFTGQGRRGQSFGGTVERKSFGIHTFRKSRASTPGSTFGRSLVIEDEADEDAMNVDPDRDQQIDDVGRLLTASYLGRCDDCHISPGSEAGSTELAVRKITTLTLAPYEFSALRDSHSSDSCANVNIKVTTVTSKGSNHANGNQSLDIYLHDTTVSSTSPRAARLRIVRHHGPVRCDEDTVTLLIAVVDEQKPLRTPEWGVTDIDTIRDGDVTATVTLATDRLCVFTNLGSSFSFSILDTYRTYDPSSVGPKSASKDQEIEHSLRLGPNRLQLTDLSGSRGAVDVMDTKNVRHQVRVRLRPSRSSISMILELCRFVLPEREGRAVPGWWCQAYHLLSIWGIAAEYGEDVEWISLVITIFVMAVGSLNISDVTFRYQGGSPRVDDRVVKRLVAEFLGDVDPARDVKHGRDHASSAWAEMSSKVSAARFPSLGPGPQPRNKTPQGTGSKHNNLLLHCAKLARAWLPVFAEGDCAWLLGGAGDESTRYTCLEAIAQTLHLFREEQKLDVLSSSNSADLVPVIAQLCRWLGWWEPRYGWSEAYELRAAGFENWAIDDTALPLSKPHGLLPVPRPPSIYEHVDKVFRTGSTAGFPSIDTLSSGRTHYGALELISDGARKLTPRISAIHLWIERAKYLDASPVELVEAMAECGLTTIMLQTFPEAVLAPLREAIARGQASPSTVWTHTLLDAVGRNDLSLLVQNRRVSPASVKGRPHAKTHEADRNHICRLIFDKDRRYVSATQLMNPVHVPVAECIPQPDWSEAEHLEQQKKLMQLVMVRTMALSPGNSMIHVGSQRPLLTERFHLPGFSTQCIMKPMDNTMTADRSGFTEEKYGWAFFHAGVSAGLNISRDTEGIDTSWILFNRPTELSNRHAGFLLALGLNGHLRSIAKWLTFKYLTPKHTMTCVGLLLGLSASYIGTMDTLITRMLSVHITRMLPPGAAEVNVSAATQTAGLMGIGLLYHNTQHRRMSEIMLSEIENRDTEDPSSSSETLRDESYRLAAGFALGLINLGRGRNLKGLHGMSLVERLLAVAIGPKTVDLVHVLDKSTAGAVIAIALIYMKSGDRAIARKVDIPDTVPQFEYVRPDIMLLRTLAKHLILWEDIEPTGQWITTSIPREWSLRYLQTNSDNTVCLRQPKSWQLMSDYIPFYNVLAGLCWSVGLKYAGSCDVKAGALVRAFLDDLHQVFRSRADHYDAKLTRTAIRSCIDIITISKAVIFAGTGDLDTMRYVRRLHGRVNQETTFGSHMAAHMAFGALFLGGGTMTFGTSDLAVASLICAFYPLFPADVLDNRVHLQAFRHLWVLAVERRCLVVLDLDTHQPISIEVLITMRDGSTYTANPSDGDGSHETRTRSPLLLPDLALVASVRTKSAEYWPVTLDFAKNPQHLLSFRSNQTIYVRRCPPGAAQKSIFSATLAALSTPQTFNHTEQHMWTWLLSLSAFRETTEEDLALILPSDPNSGVHICAKGTVVDDRLSLAQSVNSGDKNRLRNLRLLLTWVEQATRDYGDMRLVWIGRNFVESLSRAVAEKAKRIAQVS
ncbi:Anaphase-promoting complex subunit 1 [Elasticomyces elasticus]|nr:Anaphase-promoting complex subunit 1 [Elasticomyces elasticus]